MGSLWNRVCVLRVSIGSKPDFRKINGEEFLKLGKIRVRVRVLYVEESKFIGVKSYGSI